MEKFLGIAGLPRSGSTLLCQLLNINPTFHATPTSGVVNVVAALRQKFSDDPQWRARDRLQIYERYLRGIRGFIEGFYEGKQVVFDKNRCWAEGTYIRLMEEVFERPFQVVFVYRDPVDVIASLEFHHQKHAVLTGAREAAESIDRSTLRSRVHRLVSPESEVVRPLRWLRDAFDLGLDDRILLVSYPELCVQTTAVLRSVHSFAVEPQYAYDLTGLRQTTYENDGVYNYQFPHEIRPGRVNDVGPRLRLPTEIEEYVRHQLNLLTAVVDRMIASQG